MLKLANLKASLRHKTLANGVSANFKSRKQIGKTKAKVEW